MIDFLRKLWKETAFGTYFTIGGSILLGVAIIAFCITSSINNNMTQKTSVTPVKTQNIAEKHNDKVEELVKEEKLLTDPTYYEETEQTVEPAATLGFKLSVIDVGQGLCCLIECDGERMLYDGGDRDTSSFVVSYITKTKQINHLNYVVASHYDSDHISGLVGILKNCKVDTVMGAPYVPESTRTYESFVSASDLKGGINYMVAGEEFDLGSAKCTVVSPLSTTRPFDYEDESDNENRMCLGLRIVYGNTSFLLMGDAMAEEEEECVNAGYITPTDVLVVNHHGSASSTSDKFIEAVTPQISIISVGANNQYGHPTDEVLNRLVNSLVYRTDQNGTVEVVSDGLNIEIYTER